MSNEKFLYTDEQLMARLKFFIGICLALTLTGIVFVVLYSLIFVTQPLNAISPIDQKFFELIVPIATSYRDWETDRKSTRLNSSHRL